MTVIVVSFSPLLCLLQLFAVSAMANHLSHVVLPDEVGKLAVINLRSEHGHYLLGLPFHCQLTDLGVHFHTEPGYVGKLPAVVCDVKERISLSSLTTDRLDQAFDSLEGELLEFVSILEASWEHLFDYTHTTQDPKAYSFSVLSKNGK